MVKTVEREVVVEFTGINRKLARVIDDNAKKIVAFRKTTNKNLENVTEAFNAVKGAIVGVSLAVVGAGVAVRKFVGIAANLQNTADNIGINVEVLQELRFAAEQSGASARQLDDAIFRLNKRVGEFAAGGGPGARVFKEIGFEARDASGNVKNAETAFFEVVNAIGQVDTQAEKATIAVGAFGEDAGPKLVKLLAQGEDAIKALGAQAAILSEDITRDAVKIEDQYNRLVDSVTANLTELSVKVGGLFFDLREEQEKLNDLLEERERLERRTTGRAAVSARVRLKSVNEEIKALETILNARNRIEGSTGGTTPRGDEEEEGGLIAIPKPALTEKSKQALEAFNDTAKETDRIYESLNQNAIDTFKDIASGSLDAREAMKRLTIQIAEAFIKMQLLRQTAGGGGAGGLFSGLISNLLLPSSIGITGGTSPGGIPIPGITGKGAAAIQGFASGGSVAAGRTIAVGENGPELFTPDRSGKILNSQQASSGMGGNTMINIDARGAAPGVENKIAAVMREVTTLRGQIPQISINSVSEANRRNPALLRGT